MSRYSDFPRLVYRYPDGTDQAVNNLQTPIILDWSVDIVPAQFLDPTQIQNYFNLYNRSNMSVSIPVSGVSYDVTQRRVTLIPISNLLPNTDYVCLVNDKVADTTGRKSTNQYRFEFQTANVGLPVTQLASPGDMTVNNIFPTLSWYSVPLSGNIVYDVQVSDTPTFNSLSFESTVSYNQPSSGFVAPLQMIPVGSFMDNNTYYWRVSASTTTTSGTISSGWSDVWSFYFGSVLVAHPTTSATWEETVPFSLASTNFPNGSSNNLAYPPISFTFTMPVSSFNVPVVSKSLLPRNDKSASYQSSAVNGSWSSSDNLTWTFTPTDPITQNTRYELVLPYNLTDVNGDMLGVSPADNEVLFFTGPYDPYYVDIRVIRSKFMSSELQIPDDLINYHIFMASLDAKARFYGFCLVPGLSQFMGDSLKEPYVRDTPDLNSFGVLKWTEAAATLLIYRSILNESLRKIGLTRKLGDSEVALSKDFIAGIELAMKIAEEDLRQWGEYLAPGEGPMSAQRSVYWSDEYYRFQPNTWRIGGRDSYF